MAVELAMPRELLHLRMYRGMQAGPHLDERLLTMQGRIGFTAGARGRRSGRLLGAAALGTTSMPALRGAGATIHRGLRAQAPSSAQLFGNSNDVQQNRQMPCLPPRVRGRAAM